ncbi:pre-tRNA nuclear export protein [Lecanora helva]
MGSSEFQDASDVTYDDRGEHHKLEGGAFSAGDVLLEIETDKAQMDVEAQDSGQMAKITQKAGSKSVKVGTRIAIIADSEDDLSNLPLPAEDSPQTTSSQDNSDPRVKPETSRKPQAQTSASSGRQSDGSLPSPEKGSSSRSTVESQQQKYPLYPSIAQLLHEKGIPISEAGKIPASGPKGRLLKGDVLSYLGNISSSYSAEQSARISKLGKLDLSNVEPSRPQQTATKTSTEPASQQILQPDVVDTQIAIPISLASVLSVQKRIQATLGVTLPLSTFIARATKLANEALPRSQTVQPTADELFYDILGLREMNSKYSRGGFIPQITALPPQPWRQKSEPSQQRDIYDVLVGGTSPNSHERDEPPSPPPGIMAGSKPDEAVNVFSVRAAKGEEKRARVFLERVKTIIQVEPEKLIL